MLCDMCGGEGSLYKAVVEGAELRVCHECSKFGKVIGVIGQNQTNKSAVKKGREHPTEIIHIIVDDYAERVRKKREKLNLTQKELARKINEKESLMQKIESGHFEPSIGLAKRIESFLKIKLVEEYEEKHEKGKESKARAFTIGDFVKTK